MNRNEMIDKIKEYYQNEFGENGIYAYAGVLSVLIAEEELERIIKLNGIK